MSKTYKLNIKWQLLFLGLSSILIIFIPIFVSIYLAGKKLIFLGIILLMVVLIGLLIFGALSTKMVLSPNGLISIAFGKSKIIYWENIEIIELNPINLLVFAKLKHPANAIFAISPFFSNNSSINLLVDLAKYIPQEKFQKEIYVLILETGTTNKQV